MPDPEAPFVLTIDVGTSSVRALLFDRKARHVEGLEARRPYSMRTTADGGIEGDADLLVGLVEECVDELLARAARPVAAVACCTFWHSLLGVDAAGRPVTSVLTWGDMRSEGFRKTLRGRMDERAYHARTGAFIHPLYHPTKYLWIGPDRAARWMSFGEHLYARLFGRTLATVSMASGTGMLDVHSCRYDPETLRSVGVREEQLSPVGDLTDAFHGLREPWASRWPSLRDVPWHPPVGDGACNNLGSGCSTSGRIGVMVGTSGAMRVAWKTERWEVPWGLWGYRADRRRVVLGAAFNDGGNLVEWCRNTLRLGAPEEVERALAATEPDAHGLTFLPFLAGERSPGWAAHARAAVVGLSLHHRPLDVLRAGMEAVVLRFALCHGLLREALPQAKEVVASGGALLKSPAWIGMLADALGTPVVASAEPEASARGAALLVLEAMGEIGSVEEVPAALGAVHAPDPARHEKYRRALERQQRHYELLVPP
jgi:gluconokinase